VSGRPRSEPAPWERRVAIGLVAFGVALWLPSLASSFWLDETGTVWLVQGSLPDAIRRTFVYQGGSPLYYVFAWAARQMSTSEVALRAPSVVAMLGTTYLVYVLGRRLFDRRTGLLAAALFAALPAVAFAAGDARPYAFALLALVGSAVALVTWLEEGRLRHGVLYAICLVATIYLHYLIALALLAQAVLVGRFGLRNVRVPARQVLVVAGLALLLAVPLAPNALHVLGQRGVLSNPKPGTIVSILPALAPPLMLAAIAVPAAIAVVLGRRRLRTPRPKDPSFLFVVAWLLIPCAILMGLSALSSTNAFVTRYLLSTTPAICLLIAVAVSVVPQVPARYVAVGLGVASALAFVRFSHTSEDWRAAAAAERRLATDRTPVMLFAGFIEAKQASWLTHPEHSSYLAAPATAYPFDGKVFAAPWDLGPAERDYLGNVLRDHLLRSERFLLVTTGGSSATRAGLDGELAAEGYFPRLAQVWDDKIFLFVYERSDA
jgi:hypothetical protein